MKKLFLPVLLGLIVMLNTTGCSTKINTAAPYKNITLVYGLLEVSDTAHYIRIQKAFLSQNLSALDMANTPDSSFYLNLNVVVKEMYHDSIVHNTFTLNKVDMSTEGYQKDSGIFFRNPAYAYKFTQKISPLYKYRLVITNPQTGEVDSAQTIVLSEDSSKNNPTGFSIPFFDDVANNEIYFGLAPNPLNYYTFSGSAPDSTQLIQMIFRYHWVDRNVNTGAETDRYYDWQYGSTVLSNPAGLGSRSFLMKVQEQSFLDVLSQAMGPAPAGVQRFLDSSDIYFYAAPPVLYNYELIVSQAGLGITGGSIQPTFSNISGNNVYGLFSSRARRFKLSVPFNGVAFTYIVNNTELAGTGLQNTPADH